jgi:hypothetical protein
VKGKSGLQEILEEVVGEERALEIIREVEEILRAGSPFRDSIIEILDYEKQLYAVANLRKLVVVRARRDGNRLIYKERVTIGAPTEVVAYINPVGGVTKYQVKWEAHTRPRPLVIGPALIEEIVDRLRAEGLVVASRLAYDVLPAVIEGFIRRGRAVVKEHIEGPGFYIIDGRLVPVKVDVREPSAEELREALELLNELAEWYKHALDKFATAIKWGVIAPFIYAFKQMGKWVKWLYIYGASRTGKTTLGRIILAIWGLDLKHHETSGGNIDSPAKIGRILSQSTFPVLVNEPGNAFNKEDVVEIIKAAVEGRVARGRHVMGRYYEEALALAPLVFTSNRYLPRDDALLRRLIVLRFTFGEVIPVERAREFEEKVKPRIVKLKALGDFVAKRMVERPELDCTWEELAVKLLSEAYESVGLNPPEWLKLNAGVEEREFYEELVESIRTFLLERINSEYNRFVGRVVVDRGYTTDVVSRSDVDVAERVNIVLEKRLIPWLILRNDDTVLITTSIINELQQVIGDVGGLKSIAELLGWEYIPKYSFREGGKIRSISVIRTTRQALIEFLLPQP